MNQQERRRGCSQSTVRFTFASSDVCSGTSSKAALFYAQAFSCRSIGMDKQRIEGGLRKATGAVKEKAGQITGDRDLEAEGKVDKAEGRVRSAVGHAKDAARELTGKK